jgi:hypothetical protein
VNLLGDDIEIIKRYTETLIDTIKKVDLEVNVEKAKYVLVSCVQNRDKNRDIKIGNR